MLKYMQKKETGKSKKKKIDVDIEQGELKPMIEMAQDSGEDDKGDN